MIRLLRLLLVPVLELQLQGVAVLLATGQVSLGVRTLTVALAALRILHELLLLELLLVLLLLVVVIT